MGTVSFEVPGPGTYQVTCDPKLNPLSNGGTAGDILKGKQFYNDQNQAVTGTLEPAAPTYAGVLVVTVDAGAEVTATDGATTLTAASTGTATFYLPNGGTWTVSATLNGNQTAPAAVEVQENFSLALSAGASQTVTIPTQYEAELSFLPTYTVTLSVDPAGSGTATGAGEYQQGAQAAVSAAAAEGYDFSKWTENGASVSTETEYTFTVTENRELTAVFAVASKLPDGYTELEYVTTNASTRIPCGIYVTTKTTRVILDITAKQNMISKSHLFVAYQKVGTVSNGCFVYESSANQFSWAAGITSSGTNGSGSFDVIAHTISNGERVVIDFDVPNKKITFNSKQFSMNVSGSNTTISGMPLNFGGMVNFNSYYQSMIMDIHSAKVYVDGVLKGDFLPAKAENGDCGLFNLVDNTLYKATYGSITPGPAV